MSSHDDEDNGDATMELSLRDVMSFAHTDRSEDDPVFDDDTPPDGIPQAVIDQAAREIVTLSDAEATLERPAVGDRGARTLKTTAVTGRIEGPVQGALPESTVEFDPSAYLEAARVAQDLERRNVHNAATSVLSANEALLAASSWAEESPADAPSETEHTSTFEVNDDLLRAMRREPHRDEEDAHTSELATSSEAILASREVAFVGLVDEDGVVRIPSHLRDRIPAGTRVRITLIPLDD
jgi:hypothetical protein